MTARIGARRQTCRRRYRRRPRVGDGSATRRAPIVDRGSQASRSMPGDPPRVRTDRGPVDRHRLRDRRVATPWAYRDGRTSALCWDRDYARCGNFAIYRIAQHGNAIFRAFSEAARSGEINWRRRRDSTRVFSSSLVSLKNHDAGGVTGIHGGLLGGILLPRGPIDDPPRWDDRRHPQ